MISTLMICVMIIGGFLVALIAFGVYDSSASEGAQLITELIMLLASLCTVVFMAIGLFKLISFASSPNPDVTIGYRYEETIYEENKVVALKDSIFNYEKGSINGKSNSVLFFISSAKISGEYESTEKYIIRCMIEDENGIIELKEFDMDDVKLKRGDTAKAYKEVEVYDYDFNNPLARWLFVEDDTREDLKVETGKWIFEVPEDSLYSEINIDLE